MPLPALRPVRLILARRIWRAVRPSVMSTITSLLQQGYSREEAREFALDQILDLLPTLTPVILRGADAAGERLDEVLSWGWVRDPQAREWLEARDDLGPLLRCAADLALDLVTDLASEPSRAERGAGRTIAPLR